MPTCFVREVQLSPSFSYRRPLTHPPRRVPPLPKGEGCFTQEFRRSPCGRVVRSDG